MNWIKNIDIIVMLLIIGIVLLMVIPIPAFLLDTLQMLNISIAIIILLSTMYVRKSIELSSFPSLILVTTLFRLALNVSSTRLILLQGQNFQGKVIRAFGQFVVGGNYIVGVVIFLILVIIQFVVITRGAERIAEVAARFTLDAMPGKQMSVDADLSAGLITEEEARKRREEIRREADFYGAMDGASRFVRGDAIAGLIITVINIVGGLIIGVLQHGLTMADAAKIYTLFTVGDGLVAQIPALLISTSTGIIVSRAASKDNLGRDIIRELTSENKVLLITGSVILGLGLLTPLPVAPSIILGGGLLLLAFFLRRQVPAYEMAGGPPGVMPGGPPSPPTPGGGPPGPTPEKPTGPPLTTPEEVSEIIQSDTIEVDIGYGLIPLADPTQGGDLLDRITMVRKQMAYDLGIVISPIRVRDSVLLGSNEYVIKLKGVEVGRFELFPGKLLAINTSGTSEELPGIPTQEPAYNLKAYWIDEDVKDRALELGYTVVDSPSVFATHLSEVIRKYAYEILGIREVNMLVEGLRLKMPELVDELIPARLRIHDLLKVLKELLYEHVSVRNLPVIFETLLEITDKGKPDKFIMVEAVRKALGRQISDLLKSSDGRLHVIGLDPGIEEHLRNSISHSDEEVYLALDPSYTEKLISAISEQSEHLAMQGYTPVLLVSSTIRYALARLVIRHFKGAVSVVSYEEVPEDVPLSVDAIIRF